MFALAPEDAWPPNTELVELGRDEKAEGAEDAGAGAVVAEPPNTEPEEAGALPPNTED